jgi:transcription elongation GreA/GreB family factor
MGTTTVAPGCQVRILIYGDEEVWTIAEEGHGTDASQCVTSTKSPLGGALLGHVAGDTVTVTTPNAHTVRILDVWASEPTPTR